MKEISVRKDYIAMVSTVEDLVKKGKSLPENVFVKTYGYYLFLTFDRIFLPNFFENLKRFLLNRKCEGFYFLVSDPDPEAYFAAYFGLFGAVEFFSEDTYDSYIESLNRLPENGGADALIINSNKIIFFSKEANWAVFADRNSDIAVCNFQNVGDMKRFRSIYGDELLDGVEQASDYAYKGDERTADRISLCANFASNTLSQEPSRHAE